MTYRVIFACLAALALTSTAVAQSTDPAPAPPDPEGIVELRIGVRIHARPFSYKTELFSSDLTGKSGPLRSRGFDGYMVAICDAVLRQMLISTEDSLLPGKLKITPVEIEEVMSQREAHPTDPALLVVTPDPDYGGDTDAKPIVRDRMDLLGPKIDILCDPATLTRDRVKRFAVSPPLFLTGIGYLTREGYVQPSNICRDGGAFIGLVGGTTANSRGVNEIIKAGEWRTVKDKVIAELRGRPGCGEAEDGDEQQKVIQEFASHKDAATAFCEKKIDYYVGDLEIIQEHTRSVYGCDIKRGAKTFTEDRYAIFAKYDYNDSKKALWIGRFFDILNREIYGEDSVVNQAYSATFEPDSESRKLQLFFWGLSGSRY